MPEIPIRPKLFKYRLDAEKTSNYEFTPVELNQKHEILVDYNMGIRVDLIDRGVYESVSSNWRTNTKESKENQQKLAEDKLRSTAEFDERDRYLLSEKDDLPQIRAKEPEMTLSRN